MIRPKILAVVFIVSLSSLGWAEKDSCSLRDVTDQARYKEKVLVQGTVQRLINFDYFVLDDGTAQAVIAAASVRNKVKEGDRIWIYGRFQGRSTFSNYKAQIEAIRLASASDSATVSELTSKYGVEKATATVMPTSTTPSKVNVSTPTAAPAGSTKNKEPVESRLANLEVLREKKLITTQEYREQRRRILNDL